MGRRFVAVEVSQSVTLEEFKASIMREIDFISEIELIRVCTFHKCVDGGGQHFQHLIYKVCDYFSL